MIGHTSHGGVSQADRCEDGTVTSIKKNNNNNTKICTISSPLNVNI